MNGNNKKKKRDTVELCPNGGKGTSVGDLFGPGDRPDEHGPVAHNLKRQNDDVVTT